MKREIKQRKSKHTLVKKMLHTVFGQKVELSIESILSAFRKQGRRESEDDFFRTLFDDDDVLQLRLAVNHPRLFRSLGPSVSPYCGSSLNAIGPFKNIRDDVAVMTEFGKRKWYDTLWIDLNQFNSAPAAVYEAISAFNLINLEIDLNCAEIKKLDLQMPQLKKLIICNSKCGHFVECPISQIISSAENLTQLNLRNVRIAGFDTISTITNLEILTFENVKLWINEEEIRTFVGGFSGMKYLSLIEMGFDEEGDESTVHFLNEIFAKLPEMTQLKRLTFPLESDYKYHFCTDQDIEHIDQVTV